MNLKNPQSMNSYSYAEGNPINLSDPSGNCAGPAIALLPVCLGAVAGFIETKFTNPNATPLQLTIGTIGGGVQGAIAEGKLIAMGLVAGVGFVTSLAQNAANHEPLDWWGATLSGGGSALGLSMLNSAKSGVNIVLRTLGMKGLPSVEGSAAAAVSGQTVQSAYSIYTQQALSIPANSSGQASNQSPTPVLNQSQFNSLVGVANAFVPTNASQAKAVQDVITAFSTK